MRGCLIYDAENVLRNEKFIAFWMREAKTRGIELTLVTTDSLSCGIRGGLPFLCVRGENAAFDFAVMRAARPFLSMHLESMGIRVFNNAETSAVLNDKRRTHSVFAGMFPMMDTAFIDFGVAAPCPFPYPVVVKAARGCGGRGVHLAQNGEEYRRAVEQIAPDDAVVQPLCDTPGRDLRVYMLGGEIVQAMLRVSGSDFRSNFGLGGIAVPTEATLEQARIARLVAGTLSSSLIGVDFIFHAGGTVFNEAEDAVGTRMLYQYTSIDIVSLYMDHILRAMEGARDHILPQTDGGTGRTP